MGDYGPGYSGLIEQMRGRGHRHACYDQPHSWTQYGLVKAMAQKERATRVCDRCGRWETWTVQGWKRDIHRTLVSGWKLDSL